MSFLQPRQRPIVQRAPAQPPTREGSAAVAKAGQEARKRAQRAQGRAATILTDVGLELGDPNQTNQTPKKKTLLGGNS